MLQKLRTQKLFMFILQLFLLQAIFVSCVGEIEDASKDATLTSEYNPGGIFFSGVHEVKAISHNRIEVFFFPAQGGSNKYNYIINYANDTITVPSELLNPDYRGLLRYTLTGLNAAYDYIIRIDAVDQETGGLIQTERTLEAKTFLHTVADFTGISQVSNLAGVDGLDSIKVRWAHAYKDLGSITQQPGDPIFYEVVAVNANLLNPSDMDNTSYNQAQGRYFKSIEYSTANNETVMRGLPSGTRFYVRVRAIHKSTIEDFNDPGKRSELNTRYIEISTLDGNLSNLDFDTNSVVVSNNSGEEATTSMLLNWGGVTGVFDHFRLYYAPENITLNSGTIPADCKGNGQNVGGIFCKKINYLENNTMLAGLEVATNYQFLLVICQKNTCEPSERIIAQMKYGATLPQIASFEGIKGIDLASNISEIGSMFLKISPPDFNTGFFNGYVIAFKDDLLDPTPEEITEVGYSGPLTVADFDYRTATRIEIQGVNYATATTHCFSVYPFTYNNDGSKTTYPNDTWQCESTEVVGPTVEEFAGVDQVFTEGSNITVVWNQPFGGVFSHFEVFYRKTPGSIDFSQAILDTTVNYDFTNYGRVLVNGNNVSQLITNLPNGQYKIGVLTYYVKGVNGVVRSEFNTAVKTCNVSSVGGLVECF